MKTHLRLAPAEYALAALSLLLLAGCGNKAADAPTTPNAANPADAPTTPVAAGAPKPGNPNPNAAANAAAFEAARKKAEGK